ncbi:BREX system P-loop protein BrxC [Deltaproteobacteria bacterium TL4]
MITIKDVLERPIEENIAPVVYFHKQEPESLENEVREYVVTTRPGTGGETGGGIHEQYVFLLSQITNALDKKECSLPASWISGFYGSGKSSFAKLLGLALDGAKLPNGRPLSEALLARDDTPHAYKFREAWNNLIQKIDPISVVFDISATSRNDELIHRTLYREVQKRLGYSSIDSIAYFEKLLEDEKRYEEFLALCEQEYQKPWEQIKYRKIAPQNFSTLYSRLYPAQYPDPMDWFELHQSENSSQEAQGIHEAVSGIGAILNRRSPGKNLFIVIDEMSQHINTDQRKMLSLQTLVSELGARLEGKVWLLAIGQERLADVNESTVLGKMRDRFPQRFRVHLDRANVREIVYQRLLKKKANQIASLTQLIEKPGVMSKLKLEGHECGEITLESLISHYPLLPGHINLLLDISQGIRNSSTRIQSDSGSVRGVLQIIWELFNNPNVKLKDQPLGTLVTLDAVYDIQRSALNSDTLLTLDKIEEKCVNQPFHFKVAKAMALLEVIQETLPTTETLIAKVLYPALGADPVRDAVKLALKELEADHFIHEQERLGWRIQNQSGQDWIRQRDKDSISSDSIRELIYTQLKEVIGTVENPRLHQTPLSWNTWKGPHERVGQGALDSLGGKTDYPRVDLILCFVTDQQFREDHDEWVSRSNESSYKDQFIWVCGDHHEVNNLARDYLRSDKMIQTHESKKLDRVKERFLVEEKARRERKLTELPKMIRQCWLNGEVFFNGTSCKLRNKGNTFESALKSIVEENLEHIYPHFKEGNITLSKEKDLPELFQPEIVSPNPKYLDNGYLGLISMDAGKVSFTVHGAIPTRIKDYLEENHSTTGEALCRHFGKPPWGYPKSVLRASLIALLRAEWIVLQDAAGTRMTSYKDPGAKEVLLQESQFNKCEIFQNQQPEITARMKVACASFFEKNLKKSVARENDPLADAVFQYFNPLLKQVDDLKTRLKNLSFSVPSRLGELAEALRECCRDRKVLPTVKTLHKNLEVLKEGVSLLHEIEQELTPEVVSTLQHFQRILTNEAEQLKAINALSAVQKAEETLKQQLSGETPWRGCSEVLPAAEEIEKYYREKREHLLRIQEDCHQQLLDKLKQHPDFSRLTSKQIPEVTRTLFTAVQTSSPEATWPTLIMLKDAPNKLADAEAKAYDLMEEFLIEESLDEKAPVEKISLNFIKNRMVETESDLDNLLSELKERCIQELKKGKRIRII